MVEPTESESLQELDRFCEAMIAIRSEIARVESGEWAEEESPLRLAPHTATDVARTTGTGPIQGIWRLFPPKPNGWSSIGHRFPGLTGSGAIVT